MNTNEPSNTKRLTMFQQLSTALDAELVRRRAVPCFTVERNVNLALNADETEKAEKAEDERVGRIIAAARADGQIGPQTQIVEINRFCVSPAPADTM